MFYTFGIISYGCVPSKHIIQVPLCQDVRIFFLQCLEDCHAVCISAHLEGGPGHTSLEGAADYLCYNPPVILFWWLSVVFNSSISDSTKLLYKSLLDVLSVNPWEIPVAPGKNSRVPAGSPGRLHHCCRTMAGPVDTWKRCVRESTPTGYAQAEVSSLCAFHAPSQLLPLWLLSRLGPSSCPYHIFLLVWLAHWLCDWCDFPLSVGIFKCLHQGSNQTVRRSQRPKEWCSSFEYYSQINCFLVFFCLGIQLLLWLQMTGHTRHWRACQDPRSSGLSATPCRSWCASIAMLPYCTLLVSCEHSNAADGHGIIILFRNIMFLGKGLFPEAEKYSVCGGHL